MKPKQRLHQFLVAIDQAANTLTNDGWAGETLSAHCWRSRNKHWTWSVSRRVIDAGALVFFFQKDHCEDAFAGECAGVNLPPEARPVAQK